MAKIRIGRSSGNDIVLSDTTVSRSHAEIEDLGGGLYRLTDVGSSAGTFLKQGGKWSQITSAEIGADTVVRFGEAEINLSDIVSGDPATVAPRAASELGQRAEQGAAEHSLKGAGGSVSAGGAGGSGGGGGGGSAASGPGWSGLSPNYKIGIIVGGGVFVLLIVVALVLSVTGDGGPTTASGGRPIGGGPATGGGATGGSATSNPAKARLEQVMMSSCAKRGRSNEVCRCIAKNIVAGISNSDAEAIVSAQGGGGKPPQSIMRKFIASAFAAGRACAKPKG